MGNLTGNLQAKSQQRGQASWTRSNKRAMKMWAAPEGYVQIYQNLLKGMMQNYAPMMATAGKNAWGGQMAMNQGAQSDLSRRGFGVASQGGSSPMASAMLGAGGAQRRAATAEALIRFYQQALEAAAGQAGASTRSTIGAMGAVRPPDYPLPGGAMFAGQGSDFLAGLAGKVGGAAVGGG